jgi:hypothetical protein
LRSCQSGGFARDNARNREAIDAANKHNIAMIFTGAPLFALDDHGGGDLLAPKRD